MSGIDFAMVRVSRTTFVINGFGSWATNRGKGIVGVF